MNYDQNIELERIVYFIIIFFFLEISISVLCIRSKNSDQVK